MQPEDKFRKLAPISRDTLLWWLYYLSGEGPERQETEEILDLLLHFRVGRDYQKRILLEPPPPPLVQGEYPLGLVLYPDKPYALFGLREEEWIKHLLITGMTGAGKTNLAYHLLRQLRLKGKPFLVFDWKRNYRDLLQFPEFASLRVHTVGRSVSPFHFNPLIPPPHVEPGHWLVRLIDVMKHAYFLGEGVEYLLREAMDSVYEEHNLFSEPESYPVFEEVRDYIGKRLWRGRMGLWQASTQRVLAALTYPRGLGPVLNAPQPLDPSTLLNSSLILELDGLSDVDKVFFTEALLLWIYEYRKSEGKRESFKHAILIEEGHHVLSSWKERHEGQETIMETSLRQIREFGEAVIVIDQEPSKLSHSIKANTFTKMVFNLGNGKDILEMSTCLQLSKEQVECIGMLPVGHALVSLKRLGCFQPLHVVFPKVALQKSRITDEDLHPRRGAPS